MSASAISRPCTVCLTSAGAARGLALRMDHGSQYLSDHFTNRSSSGASSRPTPSSPSPRPTASPRGSIARSRNHPWSHLPQHRGAAGRRPRLRRTLQCPVDRRKERLPEPRSSSSGVARRDLNQARRVRQTCVQGTGCDTKKRALTSSPMHWTAQNPNLAASTATNLGECQLRDRRLEPIARRSSTG